MNDELAKAKAEVAEAKKAHVNAWRSQVPKAGANSPPVTALANERSKTPTPRLRHSTNIDDVQKTSTWDSMHAPASRRPLKTYQAMERPASPTPSAVSVAPTLQDDGWWS
jgi:hypothetical protein